MNIEKFDSADINLKKHPIHLGNDGLLTEADYLYSQEQRKFDWKYSNKFGIKGWEGLDQSAKPNDGSRSIQ